MLNPCVKDANPYLRLSWLYMETMGMRIKALRNAKDLSLQDLADAIGITKSAVSQWESDAVKHIKPVHVLRLCETLGTDLAYLVYGPTRKPNQDSVANHKAKPTKTKAHEGKAIELVSLAGYSRPTKS